MAKKSMGERSDQSTERRKQVAPATNQCFLQASDLAEKIHSEQRRFID